VTQQCACCNTAFTPLQRQTDVCPADAAAACRYPDDWILHASDQDYQTYYRPIESLNDTLAMEGNCANAQPGYGRNEMYPCFDTDVTYGLAITGL
jgi:hypothetical protein